jgi:hypothetical protein
MSFCSYWERKIASHFISIRLKREIKQDIGTSYLAIAWPEKVSSRSFIFFSYLHFIIVIVLGRYAL